MGMVATWRVWILRCCGLVLLAWLTGCGPGVGGTGTGAEQPPATAAPALLAPLCDSDLAPLLRCPAPGTVAAALGTGLVWAADGASQRNALARIEGNAVDLEVACAGLQFSGSWSQATGQAARFRGVVRGTAGGEAVAASLTAQRVSTGLVVQLLDAQDRALTGTFTLQVVPASPPAGACP